MSDQAIQQARREAHATNELAAWQRLEALLMRSRQSGAETFEPIKLILEAELANAGHKCSRMEAKRVAYAKGHYRKHYQQNGHTSCVSCKGSGWIRHFDTDYPCDHRSGKTQYFPCWKSEKKSETAAGELFAQFLRPLREAEDNAFDALEPYKRAERVARGSVVCYENKRARAKHKEGQKVPHGTIGEVFWIGEQLQGDRFHQAYVAKFGIKTEDGRTFYTAATNCSQRSLNAWERLHGLDGEGQRERRQKQAAADDAEKIMLAFGAEFPRRDIRVRLGGIVGKVVWAGVKGQRWRVGVRESSRSEPIWGFAADCEAV